MKTLTFAGLMAVLCLAWTGVLHSQGPAPKTPLQQLEALKAQNQQLLEKQAATLTHLAEMEKLSAQLKVMGKRS